MAINDGQLPTLSNLTDTSGLLLVDFNNPAEAVGALINYVYLSAAQFDSDSVHARERPEHECSWHPEVFRKGMILIHKALCKLCFHKSPLVDNGLDRTIPATTQRVCNPDVPAHACRQVVLVSILEHFSTLCELLLIAKHSNNAFNALNRIYELILLFSRERHDHTVCLEPVWRFSALLAEILDELSLATTLEIPFSSLRGLPDPVETFTREEIRPHLVDASTLDPDYQSCAICYDKYTTSSEAMNHTLFRHMSCRSCYDLVGDQAANERYTKPDVPYRTSCGHVLGLNCLFESLWAEGHDRGKSVGTCPFCSNASSETPFEGL